MMRKNPSEHRRTRIVATVGPASRDPEVLRQLILAGVNVFRLNLSHGEQQDHRHHYESIREQARLLNLEVAILADLCGPKIRVGTFPGGQIELMVGTQVVVTTRVVMGNSGLIPSQYSQLAQDVKVGDRILLDDGNLELRVQQVNGTEIQCQVIQGGVLRDRKGMNLPGVAVSAPAMTGKDHLDAVFALDLGVDFIAMSFVRRSEDLDDLKQLIASRNQTTPIIAKIEKPEALEVIDAIVDSADGIMVARGDLGVEMAPEKVPLIQQQLVQLARRKNKPVIVATQMLESMMEHSRPTRAEVSDVSTAVQSGADAIMLSGETAAGRFPVKAVEMMDRVARQMEDWQSVHGSFGSITERERNEDHRLTLRQAVAQSTAQLSRDLRVQAIVVRSRNGTSVRAVSATRPAASVLALTNHLAELRRMILLWGVVPYLVGPRDFDLARVMARRLTARMALAGLGQNILFLAGFGKEEPTISVLTILPEDLDQPDPGATTKA